MHYNLRSRMTTPEATPPPAAENVAHTTDERLAHLTTCVHNLMDNHETNDNRVQQISAINQSKRHIPTDLRFSGSSMEDATLFIKRVENYAKYGNLKD